MLGLIAFSVGCNGVKRKYQVEKVEEKIFLDIAVERWQFAKKILISFVGAGGISETFRWSVMYSSKHAEIELEKFKTEKKYEYKYKELNKNFEIKKYDIDQKSSLKMEKLRIEEKKIDMLNVKLQEIRNSTK